MITKNKVSTKNKDKKRGLFADYIPIKIKYDYTYLKNHNEFSPKDLNDLINIFEEISIYLSSLLLVVHDNLNINLDDIKEECEIDEISTNIKIIQKRMILLYFQKLFMT